MNPLPSTLRCHWFWWHLRHFSYVLMVFFFFFIGCIDVGCFPVRCFFLDVLMLIVSYEMGFFWDVLMLVVSCLRIVILVFFSFSFFFFLAVRCLVFFSCERRLSFQKIFFPFFFFFKDKPRNMTKGLSWWEMWKRRVFWSLY